MSRLIASASIIAFLSMSTYALNTNNFGKDIYTIDKLVGQKGHLDSKENSYKISVPRTDLDILVNGLQVTPEMGLTSWVTFKKTETQTSLNGDLVLLQDQVNPVMSVVLANNIRVTSLHNPFLWDSPRVLLMHITAEGNEFKLARAAGLIFKEMKKTMNGNGDFPMVNNEYFTTTLNSNKINSVLGVKGFFKDGVYKVIFKNDKSKNDERNTILSTNTWAAFAGSDKEAVVDGIIALNESELQKVLNTLRKAQFYILSVYQHTMQDGTNAIYVHYWGIGNTQSLAKTLKQTVTLAQTESGNVMTATSGRLAMNLPLVQSETCRYSKILTKEMYPAYEYVQHNNQQHEPSFLSLMASQLTSAIVGMQNKTENTSETSTMSLVFNLLENAYSVFHNAQIETSSAMSSGVVVKIAPKSEKINANIPVLIKKLTDALNITFEENGANPFLQSLLKIEDKNYNYIEKITSAMPVVFPASFPVSVNEKIIESPAHVNEDFLRSNLVKAMHIENQTTTNYFLSQVLSSYEKNYSYTELVSKLLYVPVYHYEPISIDVPAIQINIAGIMKNLNIVFHIKTPEKPHDFLTALLGVEEKDYDYATKIAKTNPVIFINATSNKPVVPTPIPMDLIKRLQTVLGVETYSNSQEFISVLLASQEKNYNYVEKIIQESPVIFGNAIEKREVPKESISPILVSQLSKIWGVKPQLETNELVQSCVNAILKNYNYIEILTRTNPVIFTQEPDNFIMPATNKFVAKAFQFSDSQQSNIFAQALLHHEEKNYDYINRLIKSHPIQFVDESKEGSTNPKIISKVVTVAVNLHSDIKQIPKVNSLPPLLSIPKQNKEAVIPEVKQAIVTDKSDHSFKNTKMLTKAFTDTIRVANKSIPKWSNSTMTKMLFVKNKNYNYVDMIPKNQLFSLAETKKTISATVKALTTIKPISPVVTAPKQLETPKTPLIFPVQQPAVVAKKPVPIARQTIKPIPPSQTVVNNVIPYPIEKIIPIHKAMVKKTDLVLPVILKKIETISNNVTKTVESKIEKIPTPLHTASFKHAVQPAEIHTLSGKEKIDGVIKPKHRVFPNVIPVVQRHIAQYVPKPLMKNQSKLELKPEIKDYKPSKPKTVLPIFSSKPTVPIFNPEKVLKGMSQEAKVMHPKKPKSTLAVKTKHSIKLKRKKAKILVQKPTRLSPYKYIPQPIQASKKSVNLATPVRVVQSKPRPPREEIYPFDGVPQ